MHEKKICVKCDWFLTCLSQNLVNKTFFLSDRRQYGIDVEHHVTNIINIQKKVPLLRGTKKKMTSKNILTK